MTAVLTPPKIGMYPHPAARSAFLVGPPETATDSSSYEAGSDPALAHFLRLSQRPSLGCRVTAFSRPSIQCAQEHTDNPSAPHLDTRGNGRVNIRDLTSIGTPGEDPRERLRRIADELVHARYDGPLPNDPGLDGVPSQRKDRTLTNWLQKEGHIPNQSFYEQVRALLIGLGLDLDTINELITEAIFAEREWPYGAKNNRERPLFEARKLIAIQFNGALRFQLKGIPAQNKDSTLRRWIGGKVIQFNHKLTPAKFYSQVYDLLVTTLKMEPEKATRLIIDAIIEELIIGNRKVAPHSFYPPLRKLLIRLGMPQEAVVLLIRKNIFKQKPWDSDTSTANKWLLYQVRVAIADEFGGQVPFHHNIKGLSPQRKEKTFSLWVNSGAIKFFASYTESIFFGHVQALLEGLGRPSKDVSRWISAAREELQDQS